MKKFRENTIREQLSTRGGGIEIDLTEFDGIGIVLEGTPEWVTPAQARRLAADLIAAAEAVERAMP